MPIKLTRYQQRLGALLTCALLPLSGQAGQTCISSMPASSPTSQFEFLPAGEVRDRSTGLQWSRCLLGQSFNDNGTPDDYADDHCDGTATTLDWQLALSQTSQYSGWRLPNIKELSSLVESRCMQPALNVTVFPLYAETETDFPPLWTSSPMLMGEGQAGRIWGVGFRQGGEQTLLLGSQAQVLLLKAD